MRCRLCVVGKQKLFGQLARTRRAEPTPSKPDNRGTRAACQNWRVSKTFKPKSDAYILVIGELVVRRGLRFDRPAVHRAAAAAIVERRQRGGRQIDARMAARDGGRVVSRAFCYLLQLRPPLLPPAAERSRRLAAVRRLVLRATLRAEFAVAGGEASRRSSRGGPNCCSDRL